MAASTYSHHPASQPQSYHAPSIPTIPNAPAGTFAPGTMITVGAHKCTIDRYLSEGGFAHVYLVRLVRPVDGSDVVVLKRVAVPDKEALASMRTEVDTMKRLKGHRHIVTYIDSHASHLKGGGYEVFLLMEYCSGGGLIDFMNTRLQNRLTEPEVLKIFGDVAEGVACMHYLQPPLLHRDLKVENVLMAANGGYKLCDFGSCAAVRAAPQTVVECRLMEEDIQKHTTLQYRSPEMIDVYRKLPIDEKSDVWALGVLLYKLCYYTTPFEEHGQLAILNASFKFPSYPAFSERIKKLIASMLREAPQLRPNIYQIVREVCQMRGKEIPIKDIYSERSSSQDKPTEKHLPSAPAQTPPSVVAYQPPPPPQQQAIPDVAPMRRGRPTKSPAAHSAATSRTRGGDPSPQIRAVSTDPFAALDKGTGNQDELSSRFPSVEQFSLLHDSGNKFEFGDISPAAPDSAKSLNVRLAEKLADEAFGQASPNIGSKSPAETKPYENISRGVTGNKGSSPLHLYEPQPTRPTMVSTGTMTSPSPTPSPSPRIDYPLRNIETAIRPVSRSRELSSEGYAPAAAAAARLTQQRPAMLDAGRSATHASTISRTPSSSRPSLDMPRVSSSLGTHDAIPPSRSKSANSKPRASSVYIESNMDFLRDLDSPISHGSPTTTMGPAAGHLIRQSMTGLSMSSQRSEYIESNVDFLRAMETESDANKPEKRSVTGGFVGKHVKRSSMPSITLPTAKGLLAGKFGEAFRRFERNHTGSAGAGNDRGRTRTPSPDNLMPTITGSHGTSDADDNWEVSSQDIPPEVKRELEKRRLSQEEKRVADAAALYKKQVADRVPGEGGRSRNRANSIQNKVKVLLASENRAPPPKTAEGYGRFTESVHHPVITTPVQSKVESSNHPHLRTEGNTSHRPTTAMDLPRSSQPLNDVRPVTSVGTSTKIVRKPVGACIVVPQLAAARPPPPPKPNKLRTGGSTTAISPTKPKHDEKEAGGVNGNGVVDEDWQRKFAKRYPSLSGLEMVETVVGKKS